MENEYVINLECEHKHKPKHNYYKIVMVVCDGCCNAQTIEKLFCEYQQNFIKAEDLRGQKSEAEALRKHDEAEDDFQDSERSFTDDTEDNLTEQRKVE